MKKALAILMTLALVGGAVMAEDAAAPAVTWGIWGRGVFVPVQGTNVGTSATDTTAKSVLTSENVASWGGNQRLGFSINGASENVGFHVDLTGDIASVGIGDQAKAWFKFNDMFKVEFGKVQFDALRGKVGDSGGFHRYLNNACKDEDGIFTRFYPSNGAVLEITPVEGAVIAASVNPGSTATAAYATDVYTNVQVGAGYTIAGIGQIRAQYIGNTGKDAAFKTGYNSYSYWDSVAGTIATISSDDIKAGKASAAALAASTTTTMVSNNAKIQAAFAVTAVPNLTLDIGGTIPLASTFAGDTASTYTEGVGIDVGANFHADKLGLYGRVDANLGDTATIATVKYAKGLSVNVFVEPSYALDFATIGLDGQFGTTGKTSVAGTAVDKTDSSSWGVAPFIQKNFSNGLVKVGFAYAGQTNGGVSTTTWAIPVLYQYNF